VKRTGVLSLQIMNFYKLVKRTGVLSLQIKTREEGRSSFTADDELLHAKESSPIAFFPLRSILLLHNL